MKGNIFEEYWQRLKSAWLVLTGVAYAVPYASVYQDMLVEMGKSGVIQMHDIEDITNFNPKSRD